MARSASPSVSAPAASATTGRAAAKAEKHAAKAARKADREAREPGRIRQLWLVFKMTRRHDPAVVWWLLLVFIAPVALAVIVSALILRDNLIGIILSMITGLLLGVLFVLLLLGRRAERAAFSQIEGQPGAVGAVLKSSLRRSWKGSEMPVAISPKTQDAVYRAVGKGGIALIGEGPLSRVRPMLEKERANVQRILPNVPVTLLHVGPDPDAIPLHRINRSLGKLKKALTRAEVTAVANRLGSLQRNVLPIPKGMDPFKVRAPRPR